MSQIANDVEKDVQRACLELLPDSKFRLIIAYLLFQSGVELATADNATMSYNNGRRSMGLEIARLLDSITKDGDKLYGYKTRMLSLIEYKQKEMYYHDRRK